MVDTSETNTYTSPVDVRDGAIYTVDKAETHHVQEFRDNRTGQTRKRITIGLIGLAKPVVLNETSKKNIAKIYGPNTDSWVGKKLKALQTKANIGGDLKDVLYFVPPGVDERPAKK